MILGFDTSGAHVCAVLIDGDTVLASAQEDMTRGQAERLFPLLEEVLTAAGADWSALTRIGVGVGPGNFTGIRISVAAARGLALGLGIPAVGVSTFEVIHADTAAAPGAHARLAAVPGPRDQLYLQKQGQPPAVAFRSQIDPADCTFAPDPRALAIGIARQAADADPRTRPAPLYIRPADAAPSRDAPPVILNDA